MFSVQSRLAVWNLMCGDELSCARTSLSADTWSSARCLPVCGRLMLCWGKRGWRTFVQCWCSTRLTDSLPSGKWRPAKPISICAGRWSKSTQSPANSLRPMSLPSHPRWANMESRCSHSYQHLYIYIILWPFFRSHYAFCPSVCLVWWVSEWVSSFLMADQHKIGHSVPYVVKSI